MPCPLAGILCRLRDTQYRFAELTDVCITVVTGLYRIACLMFVPLRQFQSFWKFTRGSQTMPRLQAYERLREHCTGEDGLLKCPEGSVGYVQGALFMYHSSHGISLVATPQLSTYAHQCASSVPDLGAG